MKITLTKVVAVLFTVAAMSSAGVGKAHAGTDCGIASYGGRVTVGPSTSCEFGFAVGQAFINSRGGPVVATSPVTGQTYTMTCVQLRQRVQCTGGDDAFVELW